MDFFRWMRCQWDRAAAVAALIIGLLSLLLGWWGVSRAGLPAEQIPYLASGAVFGLFALGVAATAWLSADLRDEWRKLDQIHQDLNRHSRPIPERLTDQSVPSGDEVDQDLARTGSGTRWAKHVSVADPR